MKNFRNLVLATLAFAIAMPLFNGCKKGADDPFLTLRSRKARVVGDWKATWTASTTDVTLSTPVNGVSTTTTTTNTITNNGTTTTTVSSTLGVATTTTTTATENASYSFKSDETFTYTLNTTNIVIDTNYYQVNVGGVTNWYEYRRTTTTNTVQVESGNWNFLGKGKDLKNKEAIQLATTSNVVTRTVDVAYAVTSLNPLAPAKSSDQNAYVSNYSNAANSGSILVLTELKNKEIKAEISLDNASSYTKNGLQSNDNTTTTGKYNYVLTAK